MDIDNFSDEMVSYAYGDLSAQEEAILKEKMQSNPELAEDLERLKFVIAVGKEDFAIKDILDDPNYEEGERLAEEAVQEYNARKNNRYLFVNSFRKRYIYLIAAGVALLIFTGKLLISFNNPEALFVNYRITEQAVHSVSGNLGEDELIIQNCIAAYSKGNYEAVVEDMKTMWLDDNLTVWGEIVFALSTTEERYDTYIIEPLNIHPVTIKEDAGWYLALASLKMNDLSNAQVFLRELSLQKNRRGRKAGRLERKISKML